MLQKLWDGSKSVGYTHSKPCFKKKIGIASPLFEVWYCITPIRILRLESTGWTHQEIYNVCFIFSKIRVQFYKMPVTEVHIKRNLCCWVVFLGIFFGGVVFFWLLLLSFFVAFFKLSLNHLLKINHCLNYT